MKGSLLVSLFLVGVMLSTLPAKPSPSGLIEQILNRDLRFERFVDDPGTYRLQIVLGLVEQDGNGRPKLVQHTYRAGEEYFYPASTIKLCAAVAALEELAKLRESTGLEVGVGTPLAYHPLFDGEEVEDTDPTNLDGSRITVGHEIRKLFLVSDNVAYNRLYELVGPARLNRAMHVAGLDSARLVHRLSEFRTPQENRMRPRIEIRGEGFRFNLPRRTDSLELGEPRGSGFEIGRGYMSGGELVEEAMDFRVKNRMSLVDLQRALAKVVRPDVDAGGEGFPLSDGDRALLLEVMSQLPRHSRNPVYDPETYPDHYVKFFLPGLRRIEVAAVVYNKIGQAYGFTTENAYVVGSETRRPFFLAATIYTNSDGILNDDQYEYKTVAEPFLVDLGEAVARELWLKELIADLP